MKFARTSFVVVAVAIVIAVSLLAFLPAVAQNAPPDGRACIGCSVDGKTTPRTPDGHPDLNGFWGGTSGGASGTGNNIAARGDDGSVLFDFGGADLNAQGQNRSAIAAGDNNPGWSIGSSKPEDNPTYKPEYDAKMRAIAANDFGAANRDDPAYNCTPLGVPRGAFGGPMQIVQTPQAVAIMFENLLNNRLVYVDGRSHPSPDDFDTFQMGHSIGHWEGDTLVVDTAGLSDDTWLAGSFGAPKFAIIHSDKEHVIERWTRDGDTLTWEATVEDPVMFAKPWVMRPRRMKHATAKDTDFLQPTACRITEPEHISVPHGDDQFYCNYCIAPKKAN